MSLITLTIGNAFIHTDKYRTLTIEPMQAVQTTLLSFDTKEKNSITILERELVDILIEETFTGRTLEQYIYNGSWEEAEPTCFVTIDTPFLTLISEVLDAMDEEYPNIPTTYRPDTALSAKSMRIACQKAILSWLFAVGTTAALSLTTPTLHILFDE